MGYREKNNHLQSEPSGLGMKNLCSTFLFDSFAPRVNIVLNLRVGIFLYRTKLYISGIQLANIAGSGVKISLIYVEVFQHKASNRHCRYII